MNIESETADSAILAHTDSSAGSDGALGGADVVSLNPKARGEIEAVISTMPSASDAEESELRLELIPQQLSSPLTWSLFPVGVPGLCSGEGGVSDSDKDQGEL